MKSHHHSKDHKYDDFFGLLQPTTPSEKVHGFYKLVTDSKTYFLTAPDTIMPYFKRHVWENFCVHGELQGSDVILVKRAQMQDAESNEPGEDDSLQDMKLYQHQIHQGQTLESHEDDGV